MSDEATVNPDGSTTYEQQPPLSGPAGEPSTGSSSSSSETGGNGGAFHETPVFDNTQDPLKEAGTTGGIDPAVYLVVGVLLIIALYYFFFRSKKDTDESDDFFNNLDGEKFNLKLPAEVEEYYEIKAKCEAAGWEPGKPPPAGTPPNAAGPHRVLAQALMKRAIADIPMVQHIQKESSGMNKLYAQSMCSVNQWRAYQAAEALVSSEVDEVRAEADEIEPGWSAAIWRQAMQYHQMLKQKHEMEAKAAEAEAQKRTETKPGASATGAATSSTSAAAAAAAIKEDITDEEARERAAQKAAEELLRQEEREQEAKKAFSSGGKMKKGFLKDSKGKKK